MDDLLLELKFGVEAFRSGKNSEWKRPREGRGLGMVEDGSEMEGSSGQKMTSGRLDMAEAPGWTLRVCGFLGGNSW